MKPPVPSKTLSDHKDPSCLHGVLPIIKNPIESILRIHGFIFWTWNVGSIAPKSFQLIV